MKKLDYFYMEYYIFFSNEKMDVVYDFTIKHYSWE